MQFNEPTNWVSLIWGAKGSQDEYPSGTAKDILLIQHVRLTCGKSVALKKDF